MNSRQHVYRKNFSLIILFLALITVILIIALITTYRLTASYVEGEFQARKGDVVEESIKLYNEFFQNKIPEISSYQGFLDSTSAANYSYSVFTTYPFVRKISYYDIGVSSRSEVNGRSEIFIRSVFEYYPPDPKIKIIKKDNRFLVSDFRMMADRLNDFIGLSDTLSIPTADELYRTFYDVRPDKISYLNIPRRQDISLYKEVRKGTPIYYKQDMFTFYLDPGYLRIKNVHPELYQDISIQPVLYDPLDIDEKVITTEAGLPGALANYKLYFSANKTHLNKEIYERFMPLCAIVVVVYLFLMFTGWLIYRNVNTNLKMFKLQYDFINNFTHEFKTPVSVIKIAGSNLKSEAPIGERQLKHYGKILDEEADKLNNLMNRLLSFTQLENKSIAINKQNVEIKAFAQGYLGTFKIKYPDFSLKLSVKNVKVFFTDPVLLGSIFQNLMENAYKYSSPAKRELAISIRMEKRAITFEFADKGIGMHKNELNNIFNKFYRIENQYNQNGSAGLGLAFCKELVNFMGGVITVKSKPDQGSVFTVSLPYQT